jgi:hypothetical protein
VQIHWVILAQRRHRRDLIGAAAQTPALARRSRGSRRRLEEAAEVGGRAELPEPAAWSGPGP